MRSDRVLTNLSCNQNCTFCNSRSAVDDRAFIHAGAVRRRIDEVLATGAGEVVLTGGEPGLRSDLDELIAFATTRGAQRVVLETNGTLIDAARAAKLRKAGLSLARVNVAGLAAPYDRITQDRGGANQTIAGIRALLEAGVEVQLEVAIVAASLPQLDRLPETLSYELGDLAVLRGLRLRVPVDAPDVRELVSYEAAAAAIMTLESEARRHQLQLQLAPDSGPPPCVFEHQARVAHLWSMTPGAPARNDYDTQPACARCQLSDRCAGVSRAYLARHAAPELRPITDDRTRRRLTQINTTAEQIRREHVQPSRYERDGHVIEEHIIRVNFHCNQSCRFCFVSTHLPTERDEVTRAAIRAAGGAGAKIVLSGGEPTLNPQLVEYVRLARSCSALPVNLQTNATRLGDEQYVRALVDAGLGETFVSLHGSTAEISDAITEAPGTFEKTVAGIDNLARTAVLVVLNFVICQRNMSDLVPYVRLVAARWPKAVINISFVAPMSDVVPKEAALIPRYAEVLPHLSAALAEAKRLGVSVVGFESMCGIPLCLVPADLESYLRMSDIPPGFDAGEFVKTDECRSCALQHKCYGLRRGYRDLYGDAELRAVQPEPRTQRSPSAGGAE